MIYAILILFATLCGFIAIIIKLAQQTHVRNITQSLQFALLYSLFQALILLVVPPYGNYHFSPEITVYPFCFAIFSLISQLLMLNALKNGPTSLTNVILRSSALIPTAFGIFLWRESLSIYQLGGLLLFLICMLLFNNDSYIEGCQKKSLSFHWLVIALLSSLSNGIAITFTKQYMVQAVGPIRDYLFLFNGFIAFFCIIFFIIQQLLNKNVSLPEPQLFYYTLIAALFNNIANYIYMDYVAKYNSAFFFPATSICSLLAVLILSVIILKERLQPKAKCGIFLSLIAIYILSLH